MTTKTAAKSGKKAPARKATGKAKTPAQRVVSSVQIVRDTLARNPKATVQMIDAALKRAGFEKSANFISTIKSDFMGSYRALAAAGALSNPVL